MKIPFMIAVWAALVPACTYKDYYLAERNWSFEEPFLLECLTEYPAKDGAKINRTVAWLKKKYPNVFFVPQTLPIRVDVQERKHRDRAPITRFMTGTHGVHGTIARFEKKLPTRADWDRVFTSPVKRAMIKTLLAAGHSRVKYPKRIQPRDPSEPSPVAQQSTS